MVSASFMGHHAPSPLFFGPVSIPSWKVCYMFTLFMIICVREGVTTPLCLQNQSLALLEFKQSIPVSAAVEKSLSSWRDGTDCCRWAGVSCDRATGFVTGLNLSDFQLEVSELDPASLIKLHHLNHLDLSLNSISGVIPSRLFELTSLSYLDLSFCDFYGPIPKSFKQLSNLKHLDLGENQLSGEIPPGLLNHPTLQSLDLWGNRLNGSLPDFGSGFSVLRKVNLALNMLDGEIPSSISNLPQLEALVLAFNKFNGTIHLSKFQNGKNLSELDLSYNDELTVELPEAAIFPHLETLELVSCRIKGEFPLFLQSAKRLKDLDLAGNHISGKIPTWLGGLPNLAYLDLSENMFNGFDEIVNISAQAAMFPQLDTLSCQYCNIKGEFLSILQGAKRIRDIWLSHNNISGKIPMWVWSLTNLEELDLSNNMLHGFEEEAVYMSDSVNSSREWGGMTRLDLSNNNIRGPIPPAVFCNRTALGYLRYLSLLGNSFSGTIPDCITNLTNLGSLDLSSNQLQGQVPRGLISKPNLGVLNLKGNQLTGKIARLLHNCSGGLQFLDLSNNSFTGSLPNNWLTGFDGLQLLDLSNNDLHGPIPEELIVNFTKSLRVLALHDNKLTGKVPRSLSNCSQLEIVDLGSNELTDMFPFWLVHLQYLRVLILHSNKLYGNIMPPKYAFSSLQILDISRNQFLGHLPPELFQNLHSMMWKQSEQEQVYDVSYYAEEVNLDLNIKGQTEVWKLMIILTSIDLSDNLFIGNIPEAIGALEGLYSLNLSRNSLDGPIPTSLGQLREVESLDLSHNNLSGSIPEELMRDTFLSVLDLSYNNLQGRIPQGNQFNTFNAASFAGNSRLCGPPLAISCPSNKSGSQDSINRVEGKAQDPNWEYLAAGIGVAVGVLTITLPLMFIERFASRYWNCMDRVVALLNLQDIL